MAHPRDRVALTTHRGQPRPEWWQMPALTAPGSLGTFGVCDGQRRSLRWRQCQLAAGGPGGRAGISMESVWALGLLPALQVVLRLHLPLRSLAPTAGRRHGARGLPDQGQREAGRRLCPLRCSSPLPGLPGRRAWCLLVPKPFLPPSGCDIQDIEACPGDLRPCGGDCPVVPAWVFSFHC